MVIAGTSTSSYYVYYGVRCTVLQVGCQVRHVAVGAVVVRGLSNGCTGSSLRFGGAHLVPLSERLSQLFLQVSALYEQQ